MCIFSETFSCAQLHLGMEFRNRAPNQRTHQTIKHNNQMKNPIRSLALGIALFGAASAAMAQSTILSNAQTPTLTTTNSTFSFSRFDSNLGTLTAVDLLLNSASISGSILVTNDSGDPNTLSVLQSRVQIFNSGLAPNPRQTLNQSLFTALTPTPGELAPTQSATYTLSSPQSLISSVFTSSISGSPWSLYQAAGGGGSTPTFNARISNGVQFSDIVSSFPDVNYSLSADTNFTLRYTYTPSGPVPVPEPGQVAASLLLLGGIGAYYFVKRRRKSAPAAA
jgi:hypothetical protein